MGVIQDEFFKFSPWVLHEQKRRQLLGDKKMYPQSELGETSDKQIREIPGSLQEAMPGSLQEAYCGTGGPAPL